jgi:hypothetical protein
MNMRFLACTLAVLSAGCATPPSSDPSTVEASCAEKCSGHLATCSSGIRSFPVVRQKQCNDTYDMCIKGCPPRTETAATKPVPQSTAERLKKLDELFKSGVITKEEYDAKRKNILDSL